MVIALAHDLDLPCSSAVNGCTWLMRRVSVCAAPIYRSHSTVKQHTGLPRHPQKLKLSKSVTRIAAVGGRIKYLVDTPETLWGCLDAGSFLAAAHRFLRASLVYEALQGGDAASAMRQFPLVRTQWPLVAKFRFAPYWRSKSPHRLCISSAEPAFERRHACDRGKSGRAVSFP